MSATLGNSSLGQFNLASLGGAGVGPFVPVVPAPADRTFTLPQCDGMDFRGDKTPADILNYSFNWAKEINADLIINSVWTLESVDLTIRAMAVDASETIVTILLSGGIAANIYNVTNTITTESGLVIQATFRLFVSQYNF